MKPPVRVLHLLRAEERMPPAGLLAAANSIHLLRAGNPPDAAVRQFGANVITIVAPFDYDARIALAKVAELELPSLGFGKTDNEPPTITVSLGITPDDLRAVLEMLAASVTRRTATECPAEQSGSCRGRMADGVIGFIEHLLYLRIPDYRERAERVLEASIWIANHLCLPPSEMRVLVQAARVREIGKLGLPDRLLFARRIERTADEQIAYDRYPALGAGVLRDLPDLKQAAHIVEHQLENFDGSGPANLMAHQIPLASRILRVAGAFSMIISTGDNAQSAHDVIKILDRGRGSLYDPLLVKLVENYHNAEAAPDNKQATRLVRMADLEENMVIAEDVWSRTGMKLVPAGTFLSPKILQMLKQFPLDPSLESIRIVA